MDPEQFRSAQSQTGVSPFWAEKHANDSSTNWDKFYQRNSINFFKDRHWTTSESTDGFPCLLEPCHRVVVEAGCGVANCAFPLLHKNRSIFVYAFDFAPTAIRLIKESERYDHTRIRAFVWDFSSTPIHDVEAQQRGTLSSDYADICVLVFVLSAIPPEKHLNALRNLFILLKPGGKLLFRDYATGDLAQTRFSTRSRIDDNYFVRQDRTLSFFFDEQNVRLLATEAGFEELYVKRVSRLLENRKRKLRMDRVFLQAEFVKPHLQI